LHVGEERLRSHRHFKRGRGRPLVRCLNRHSGLKRRLDTPRNTTGWWAPAIGASGGGKLRTDAENPFSATNATTTLESAQAGRYAALASTNLLNCPKISHDHDEGRSGTKRQIRGSSTISTPSRRDRYAHSPKKASRNRPCPPSRKDAFTGSCSPVIVDPNPC